jgi:serine phosphatase RsbU (regulator of sigma subunit)
MGNLRGGFVVDIKNRLVLILIVSNVLFMIAAFGSCKSAGDFKRAKQKEAELKFASEEKLNEISRASSVFEERVKQLTAELAQEKAGLEAAKKALVQEQLINQGLKSELDKLIKLKDALEQDLKEALVNSPRKK